MKTKIEWAEYTWNPVSGCSKISAGCQNCYAERMSKRLAGRCGYPTDNPFCVTLHPDRLLEPLNWKKSRMIFVCSMGDLFHSQVPGEYIAYVLKIAAKCPQHIFMILTKRIGRARLFFNEHLPRGGGIENWGIYYIPSNVWVGCTVENQEMADKRIPDLLHIPSTVRFISVEPMLGPIDLLHIQWPEKHKIGWVICGGETGPKARPVHPDWIRNLRDECQKTYVPFFFRGWGEYGTRAYNCTTGLPVFKMFPNKQKWIHKGDTWVNGGICLDMTGKIIRIGADFDTAQYPVAIMHKMGKKKAGHLLDDQEWKQMPEIKP